WHVLATLPAMPHPIDGDAATSEMEPVATIVQQPSSRLAESFRVLRAAIRFRTADHGGRIVGVTSVDSALDPAATALGLATVCALAKEAVLLIDAAEQPAFNKLFPAEVPASGSDHIDGSFAAMSVGRSTVVSGLDVVRCSTAGDADVEMLLK